MSSFAQTILAFALYLGGMIAVGLYTFKKTKNVSDFFLGDRKLGPWFTALSAEASDMSAWLLMGLPGVAYLTGMTEAFWTALGLLLGTYLNWLIVAKRLRRYSIHAGNAITIPEFLTNRFHDKSNVLNTISALLILFFFVFYTASGFVACAKLFQSVMGISYTQGLALGVGIVLVYTLLGGFLAVCSTDFIQGTLMFIALVATMIAAIVCCGGVQETAHGISEFGKEFLNPFTKDHSMSAMSIISSLGWGLGYFGMPHILVRFMAIRSNKDITLSRRIAMVWVTIAMGVAVIIGVVGKVYLPAALGDPAFLLADKETVFVDCLKNLFPAFIGGIFLCSIFAASMSTADSQLLVGASAFSKDVYKAFIRKGASDKEMLNVSRITVLVIAAIGVVLAMDPQSSIFNIVSYAWAGFGATFGPVILVSLLWKNATRNGAIAGLIGGGITVIVWNLLSGGIFNLYELIPGFIVGLIAMIVVSLKDKKDPEVVAEFEAFAKESD